METAAHNFVNFSSLEESLPNFLSNPQSFWYSPDPETKGIFLNAEQIAKLLEGKTREEMAGILETSLDAVAEAGRQASATPPVVPTSVFSIFFGTVAKWMLGFSAVCFGLSGLISLAN